MRRIIMIFIRRFSLLSLLLCLLLESLPAQQDRLTARIDNNQSSVPRGRVHPRATAQNDAGAVEGSFSVPGITLLLKRSAAQQAAFEQLTKEQQDPSSPNFHKWLTPEEYADRFGISANDMNAIGAWLQSQGFTIANASRSRTWITVTGTAAQVRSTFRTQIHRYNVNGQTHYANATAPAIPTSLANIVAGFRGLDDFHPTPRHLKKQAPELTTGGGVHHLAPDDFATIYNVAPLYQAGVDGTGQKIVVVGQTGINLSDITSFRSNFNLPAVNLQQVRVPGRPNPGVSLGDLGEADLDIEWAGAVARNATIVYVYSDDVWQSALYAVDQNLAPVLSMSYGACEQFDLVDLPYFQSVVQQANAQGMTWLAASGDAGAGDCEDPDALIAQNGFAVDAPASIPEVTAMGGTEFNEQGGAYWSSANTANGASALSYIPEKAWNDTTGGFGLAAGGGGASVFFPRPSWQTGPGIPNDGYRHVPDLSLASSANHDGYYVYSSGGAGYYGGTSAAAPTMAGIVALLNQYLVSTGFQAAPGLGNINPTLYRLAQSQPSAFHDVQVGDNIVPCVTGSPDCPNGSLGFSAGANYDEATGLGSVDASNLLHLWSASLPAAAAIVPSINNNPVYQKPPNASGNSWTFGLTLKEEAGVGATLTDFTIDGVSSASQITTLFGSSTMPARGSISATLGLKGLAVPKIVVFGFAGFDTTGHQWTTKLSVPFNGTEKHLAVYGISNSASGQQVYAPGMLMSIYGDQLGTFAQSAGSIPLPEFLGSFAATINDVSTPLYYVSQNQVNLQIPYETQPGAATLVVGNPYEIVSYQFQVTNAGPGIFMNLDGTVCPTPSGRRGDQIVLYITGDGLVRPQLATGDSPAPLTPLAQLPKPRLAVSVTIGGAAATTQVIGIPPGLVGVTQLSFTVPDNATLGVQQVVVTVGTTASPPVKFTVTQ